MLSLFSTQGRKRWACPSICHIPGSSLRPLWLTWEMSGGQWTLATSVNSAQEEIWRGKCHRAASFSAVHESSLCLFKNKELASESDRFFGRQWELALAMDIYPLEQPSIQTILPIPLTHSCNLRPVRALPCVRRHSRTWPRTRETKTSALNGTQIVLLPTCFPNHGSLFCFISLACVLLFCLQPETQTCVLLLGKRNYLDDMHWSFRDIVMLRCSDLW